MAIRPTDPEALLLYQLIGAPLLAVIQAEAQAAQVSADFISRIGFEPRTVPDPPAEPAAGTPPAAVTPATDTSTTSTPAAKTRAQSLQDGGDIGALRVAEFRIDRIGGDGKLIPYQARVPVLSLYPIPLMQVKHAEFDFDIRVVTRVPLEDPLEAPQPKNTAQPDKQVAKDAEQNKTDDSKASASSQAPTPNYLDANRVELKGFLANTRGGAGGRTVTDASIKVRVRMEQSDLPAGLIQLLKMMDDNVSVVPKTQANPNEKPVQK